ncbi:MAG: polyprenyl synthetase family protein [Chitinophagaceae bacterium]|nr:polyprenyl synthetase family protein [Chitinophagaceae bacterium]
MLASQFLSTELKEFDNTFNEAVKSHIPLLDIIMQYVARRKGKQLRPIFVLLTAKMCGKVTEQSYRAAALIELLHTATLVHDDVVDDAETRRGFFSINAIWKNKIAVLVGDYLLSKGLLLSLGNGDFTILQILSTAVKEMSEGELLQLEKSRKLDITEEVYFEIIKAKTASLISSACAAGAYSSSADKVLSDKCKLLGENIGMAFQIKDDLFDYGTMDVGKPTGNDIKEKKVTLPLIYTMQQCDARTKSKIKYILKNNNKDKKDVQFIIDKVIKTGGVEYAETVMKKFINNAYALLNDWPASEAKEVMKDLINYTIDRKK